MGKSFHSLALILCLGGLLVPVNLFAATRGANMGHASDSSNDGLWILLGLIVGFLAMRHVWLWFWKINRIEALLEELVDLQRKAIEGKEGRDLD